MHPTSCSCCMNLGAPHADSPPVPRTASGSLPCISGLLCQFQGCTSFFNPLLASFSHRLQTTNLTYELSHFVLSSEKMVMVIEMEIKFGSLLVQWFTWQTFMQLVRDWFPPDVTVVPWWTDDQSFPTLTETRRNCISHHISQLHATWQNQLTKREYTW